MEAISGGTTISVTIEALVGALITMAAAARAYWGIFRQMGEMRREVESLKEKQGKHADALDLLKESEYQRRGAERARMEPSGVMDLPR